MIIRRSISCYCTVKPARFSFTAFLRRAKRGKYPPVKYDIIFTKGAAKEEKDGHNVCAKESVVTSSNCSSSSSSSYFPYASPSQINLMEDVTATNNKKGKVGYAAATIATRKVHKLIFNENVLSHLSKNLDISRKEAQKMVTHNQKLNDLCPTLLGQRVDFLVKNDVARERLCKMSWLLRLDSDVVVEEGQIMKSALNLDFNCAVSLMRKPTKYWLERTESVWTQEQAQEPEFTMPSSPYRNRVDYMAEKLGCDPWTVTDMIRKKPAVGIHPFPAIRDALVVLVDEARIYPKQLAATPDLLFVDVSLMRTRVNFANQHNIGILPTALFFNSDKLFKIFVQEKLETRSRRLETSPELVKFLQTRLHCVKEQAEKIALDIKPLRRMELSQIDHTVNLLLSMGLTESVIRSLPGILCENEATHRKRFERLKSIGISLDEIPQYLKNISYRLDKHPISIHEHSDTFLEHAELKDAEWED